jgi:hypothetical protein
VQIEQQDLMLVGVLGDAFEDLFDACEEPVAETLFALVEPVALSFGTSSVARLAPSVPIR